MVLWWLTSSGSSELCCHIHVCVSLFPLSPPAMSSPAHPAFSCSDKMPPTKEMFSATSSLFSPSTACPKAALHHPNDQADGKGGISRSAQPPAHLLLLWLSLGRKSKTGSLLPALCRNSIIDNFTTFTPILFSWLAILLPFSLVLSPFTLP